jgi:hypothetical protein
MRTSGISYIYQGPQIILSVDCDAFGLTADVSGIKVPGDPLTISLIHKKKEFTSHRKRSFVACISIGSYL